MAKQTIIQDKCNQNSIGIPCYNTSLGHQFPAYQSIYNYPYSVPQVGRFIEQSGITISFQELRYTLPPSKGAYAPQTHKNAIKNAKKRTQKQFHFARKSHEKPFPSHPFYGSEGPFYSEKSSKTYTHIGLKQLENCRKSWFFGFLATAPLSRKR